MAGLLRPPFSQAEELLPFSSADLLEKGPLTAPESPAKIECAETYETILSYVPAEGRETIMARNVAARKRVRGHAPAAVVEAEHPMMSTTAVRDKFADVFSRVSYGNERILVGRRGNASKAVAMIPAADLKVLEEMENRLDLLSALKALKANENEKTVPWEELKRKLGL